MNKQEEIMAIAGKRGFFYPSAEIYKASAGFWTYGHLGKKLKLKFENLWRNYFLRLNPNYVEIQDCNILPKKVFESSGHIEHFNDPLVECSKCHTRYRADNIIEEKTGQSCDGLGLDQMDSLIKKNKIICDKCKSHLGDVKFFNMMFELKVGAVDYQTMYLRPETAQAAYLAFKREYEALRRVLPMGLAVIGKAYRNEINPRQGFFRLREFTQAELQIFFDPDKIDECEEFDSIKDEKLIVFRKGKINEIKCSELIGEKLPKMYVYHMHLAQKFYLDVLKIPKEKFRMRELGSDERAFYNKIHFDIELDLETLGGFKEVSGIHYRGDHDLGGHQKGSNVKLEIIHQEKKVLPHVLELSFGVDRIVWAFMDLFYFKEEERNGFKFPYVVCPYDVAVFPLVNKEELPAISKKIFDELFESFDVFFDDSGSIGRRYRRQDEIGTHYCVTADFDSVKDGSITLRDRDSMKQERVKISEIKGFLKK